MLLARVISICMMSCLVAGVFGCASVDARASTNVTVRLWDQKVAEAYRASFDKFEALHPEIRVDVRVVPWSDYWTLLRTDIASGAVDDIFWVNAANYRPYADSGDLVDISEALPADAESAWTPQVVAQYTHGGRLWGVPQLTDPGIGILYNANHLREAGLSPEALNALYWDPRSKGDSLRAIAKTLTLDINGLNPESVGFDPSKVRQWGYSASNDLNAILLQFLGSNGASWQQGDSFTFDTSAGREALQYVVDLIAVEGVAPPASDTNPPTGNDAALRLFLEGRLALFQTGAYNLANVQESVAFDWGVAEIPVGPLGAISVTNGVVAAGWAGTEHPTAQREVLGWLGSVEGSKPIGSHGAALPAVLGAQSEYFEYWRSNGVDISPMLDVLGNGSIQAPRGNRYAAAEEAYRPIFNQIFLGDLTVSAGLRAAQAAANDAIE